MSGRARWNSLNGKHGLANVFVTSCLGIPKSLSDGLDYDALYRIGNMPGYRNQDA